MRDPVIEKYLSTYAEPLAQAAARLEGEQIAQAFLTQGEAGATQFDSAVVIPALDEEPGFARRLVQRRVPGERSLAIVVINARELASASALKKNEALVRELSHESAARPLVDGVSYVPPTSSGSLALLIVDATSPGRRLGPKEGVGRARKMGLDLALALHRSGALTSPFVGSTDADAWLPSDYFGALRELDGECSGALFPYRHRPSGEERLDRPMAWVEVKFRYYVLGLAHANSPYSYHSLGSALAVNLAHYARVRGVPNRQAGEDFYLLSKLSKLAPLQRLDGPEIEIETRLSARVPFGTGPALNKAIQEGLDEPTTYHPRAFEQLKQFLRAVVEAATNEDEHARERQTLVGEADMELWVAEEARRFLREASPHLRACPSGKHREHRVHERFDALTTLQFIHRAHREGLEMMPIRQALNRLGLVQYDCSPEEILKSLRRREAVLGPLTGLKNA